MILVDTSFIKQQIIHSRFFSEKIKNDAEIFVFAFLNSILKLKRQFGASKDNRIILCIDRKGYYKNTKGEKKRGYWRHVYYDKNIQTMANPKEYYKYGRKFGDDGIDWETIERLYAEVLEMLDKYTDFTVIEVKGVEADDIIAILAQKSKQKVIIVSVDKDLKQLISDNVFFYNYTKDEYENNALDEVENNLFFLKGDAGDAICGVIPRYQWKKFIIDKKHSLDEALQIASSKKNIDVDILKKRFEINKKLMDLSLNNLPNFIIKQVMEKIKEQHYNFKQRTLTKKIVDYRLHRFLEGSIKSIDDRIREFKLNDVTKITKTVKDTNKFDRVNDQLNALL